MTRLRIFVLAAVFVWVCVTPSLAEIKIGGIVFTDLYYLSENKHASGVGHKVGRTAVQVPNISRLYARWTNEDDVGMYIELGMGQRGGKVVDSDDSGVNLRYAYGWWDITPMFQVLAGKTTTPFSPLTPQQLLGTRSGHLNIIGEGYGEFYSGRFAQVRGTVHFNDNIRLAVALVDPNGTMAAVGQQDPYGGIWDKDTKIPRIDVGMPIYLGSFKLYPSVFWQQRRIDVPQDKYSSYGDSFTSWGTSMGLRAGFGPLTINAEGNFGKNWGNTRGSIGISPAAKNSNATVYNGRIDNTKCLAWWVDVGLKLGVATPHLLYGSMNSSGDRNPMDHRCQMYGVSMPIDVAKGFRIRPEVMWYDDGNKNKSSTGAKSNDGNYSIYGVQFQITF